MIPISRKFPMRDSFLEFRRHAKRLSSEFYTFYFLQNTHPSRLAVVVPKKCAKLATTRNWLKRLTYDVLWPLIQDKNLDVVVVYKPITLSRSSETKEKIISAVSNITKLLNY